MIKVGKDLTRDLNKDGMPDQYGLVYPSLTTEDQMAS
jgi:hypothetical protein